MTFGELPAYPFTEEAIREEAPAESGVYGIFTPTRWVLIGDDDNMRRALFERLNVPDDCLEKHHPLSFSCEVVPPAERAMRRDVLIAELRPACNGPR